MKRFAWLLILSLAGPALAQAPDPHAGHAMPVSKPPVDPHAGHVMPAPAVDPHAGHRMPMPVETKNAPPPAPTDHAADQFFSPADMAIAREGLRREHGGMGWSKSMLEIAEYRPGAAGDGYAWEGRISAGGDINRFVFKSQGEGAGGHLEDAEVHGLYSRAITPYFNLQAGVRHDIRPTPRRTYATLGIEGLAPYWFEIDGALFLSDKGDVSARFEASYDLRLTSRVTLEPRLEANLQAQDIQAQGVGAGLSDMELGLRLRYALTPEVGPYVGVNHMRKLGDTADLARARGEEARDTRLVVGVRAWF